MYTVMAPTRSIMKDMKLPKSLWDLIAEAVVYTKNRTITSSGSNPGITPFESGNKVVPDVSNLRALGCRAYTHIPKTTNRHKLDERSWKGIHVGYGGNNQWKIYNPRTKKVHLTRDVKFDEAFSFYDEDSDAPDDWHDDEEEGDFEEFWMPVDDELLDFTHPRRQAPVGVGGGLPTPEPSSQASIDGNNSNAEASEEEELEFHDFGETHDHNLDDRHPSPLPDSPIPETTMPAPRIPEQNRGTVSSTQPTPGGESSSGAAEASTGPEEPSPENPAAPAPKKRGKAPAPPPSDRKTRTQTGDIPRPDYKASKNTALQDFGTSSKPTKGSANVVHNVYQDKQVSKSHIHMVRALNALKSGESFGLAHVSEPLNYKQARASPHWPEWRKSMEVEIGGLIEAGTWILVDLPKGRIAITGRWVFRIKYGIDGRILKFKARWVVHGYKQQPGVDYIKTWAGIVKASSFRTLFGLAAERRLHAEQMDIVTAFLYGLLDEIIFVNQPDGFIADPSLVCQLLKALYGLKQSPRVWYGVISDFLKSLGFTPSAADKCVFVSKDKKTFIAIYVDDLLIVSGDMDYIKTIKAKLASRFKMTDLGPAQHYLGIEITRTGDELRLRQTAFLTKVLERFGMDNCRTVDSPVEPGCHDCPIRTVQSGRSNPDGPVRSSAKLAEVLAFISVSHLPRSILAST